ncbi:hypothetical protein [Brachyspira pilosicoli]|uniref:hypothetical protein n=1 Tax=Brachyspira pilosicoli TaxID=52584 RepID=UPI000C78BC36|nr:hypothetical protein [Brachyspira pilosicoli]PLV61109.1 hypothetical protein BPSP16_06465 [Brachyspira pilosicoli SP16]
MKKILLIMLSIMFAVLSCKSATAPIDSKRTGTYVSAKPVNGSSYLAIAFDGAGGFKLYYSQDAAGTLPQDGKVNTVTGDDMRGEDPNYNFQTGVMGGSLQFISDTVIKVTVNFNDGSAAFKDVLCYKKN